MKYSNKNRIIISMIIILLSLVIGQIINKLLYSFLIGLLIGIFAYFILNFEDEPELQEELAKHEKPTIKGNNVNHIPSKNPSHRIAYQNRRNQRINYHTKTHHYRIDKRENRDLMEQRKRNIGQLNKNDNIGYIEQK